MDTEAVGNKQASQFAFFFLRLRAFTTLIRPCETRIIVLDGRHSADSSPLWTVYGS